MSDLTKALDNAKATGEKILKNPEKWACVKKEASQIDLTGVPEDDVESTIADKMQRMLKD